MDMLAIARIDLGLSEDEFWRMGPPRFTALQQRRCELMERDDYRTGTITALIKRMFGVKNPHPLDDFGRADFEERKKLETAKATLKAMRQKRRNRK